MDSQPDGGSEATEDRETRSPRQDTCSTQGPNGASSRQSPANSWVEELTKRREEAKELCERKRHSIEEAQRKIEEGRRQIEEAQREIEEAQREIEEEQREFNGAQQVMASCETLIENEKKERTT